MQILGFFLCMVFLIDLLTYPYKKSFQKKSVLKIFIILFEQDCPEAVVHDQTDATTNKIEFILRFFSLPHLRMSVLRISVNSEAVWPNTTKSGMGISLTPM